MGVGTKEGAKKGVETRLKKDPDYFKKLSSMGGKSSGMRGFRDIPGLASKAAYARWAKVKKVLDNDI